jgi:hypothetical protein
MTRRDAADTDPGGPPVLEEWPSEGDHFPPDARAGELRASEPSGAASWQTPAPELTHAEQTKENAKHDQIMLGLRLTGVNRRRREELVEAPISGGRAFAIYSGVGRPAARTTLVASADAPTVRVKRRRMSGRLGVVLAGLAMAVVAAFCAARFAVPSAAPAPAPAAARGAAWETSSAIAPAPASAGRKPVEVPTAEHAGPTPATRSTEPIVSAKRWAEPPGLVSRPARVLATASSGSSRPWLVLPER